MKCDGDLINNLNRGCSSDFASALLYPLSHAHKITTRAVAQVSILLGGMKGGAGVVIRHDQKTGEWGMPTGFGLVGGQVRGEKELLSRCDSVWYSIAE